VLDHLREQRRDTFVSAAFLAAVHIGLGEVDEAFAALAQAETQHSYYVAWWKLDPELDPFALRPALRGAAEAGGVGAVTARTDCRSA